MSLLYAARTHMAPTDWNDEDDELAKDERTKPAAKDFDCPSCNANNPLDESLRDGQDVLCNYCGSEFRVAFTGEGRVRFKEM